MAERTHIVCLLEWFTVMKSLKIGSSTTYQLRIQRIQLKCHLSYHTDSYGINRAVGLFWREGLFWPKIDCVSFFEWVPTESVQCFCEILCKISNSIQSSQFRTTLITCICSVHYVYFWMKCLHGTHTLFPIDNETDTWTHTHKHMNDLFYMDIICQTNTRTHI